MTSYFFFVSTWLHVKWKSIAYLSYLTNINHKLLTSCFKVKLGKFLLPVANDSNNLFAQRIWHLFISISYYLIYKISSPLFSYCRKNSPKELMVLASSFTQEHLDVLFMRDVLLDVVLIFAKLLVAPMLEKKWLTSFIAWKKLTESLMEQAPRNFMKPLKRH